MSFLARLPRLRVAYVRLLALVALVAAGALAAPARAAGTPPLGPENFSAAAPEGFGDRNDSWPWAMQFWENKLYVGTNSAFGCVEAQSYAITNPGLPYPPTDVHENCPSDPTQIPLQAEIWAWDPATNLWTRVFQSPLSIPNPSNPAQALPPDIGFRTATQFLNPYENNANTLCFGGMNAAPLGYGAIPPPRILCTTDGVTFTPVPQNSGTFMGTLPQTSMRGLTFWNNQLWVVNGTFQGNGPMIVSVPNQDPLGGNNNWTYAASTGGNVPSYYDLQTFNGSLYTCETNTSSGYAIAQIGAGSTPPYTWTPVVSNGASLPNPSPYCLSMYVFADRLYAGSSNPSELVRINPDNTWDLVVGTPRVGPSGQMLYPLSGLGEGFDNGYTIHIWRMGSHNGYLYTGTADNSYRVPGNGDQSTYNLLQPIMGADLWTTSDGWNFTQITNNGFSDMFESGIRNFADTPYGLFIGMANFYYGLDLYRGLESSVPAPILPPTRMTGQTSHGQYVLSWDPVPNAVQYLIFQAPVQSVAGSSGNPGTTFPWPFVQYANTSDTVFVDAPPVAGSLGALYEVVAVDAYGNQSDPSNAVELPEITPAMTFTTATADLNTLQSRSVFRTILQGQAALDQLSTAQSLATAGNLVAASDTLKVLDLQVRSGALIDPNAWPDGTDLDLVISALERQLKLVQAGVIDAGMLQ